MDFKELIGALSKINVELKEQSLRSVNILLTLRNWFFGFYILEFEQNGNDRAEYGKTLLSNIANEMVALRIPNTDERELRRCRQFYICYPDAAKIIATDVQVLGLLDNIHIEIPLNQIRGTLSPELKDEHIEDSSNQIRGSLNPEFKVHNNHYIDLFKRISYTHFIELIRIEEPLKRLFYELECIRGTWSVRELKRQIGSLLYERTGLSGNKEKLIALTHQKSDVQAVPDFIRDPYVFEFIGLKQREVLLEKDLEEALIDLVFYHRLLHCNVLIDLKTERFNHSYASQLNMYFEYYKKYEVAKGDNPPIGILLCTNKDQEHVEFATAGMDDKVFVSQYLVALPGKYELEQFIKKELSNQ